MGIFPCVVIREKCNLLWSVFVRRWKCETRLGPYLYYVLTYIMSLLILCPYLYCPYLYYVLPYIMSLLILCPYLYYVLPYIMSLLILCPYLCPYLYYVLTYIIAVCCRRIKISSLERRQKVRGFPPFYLRAETNAISVSCSGQRTVDRVQKTNNIGFPNAVGYVFCRFSCCLSWWMNVGDLCFAPGMS
jgi:hypothetical protein